MNINPLSYKTNSAVLIMNRYKIYFLILFAALLLQGCNSASEEEVKSEIFGSVAVIDENGWDITEYCNVNLRENYIFVQKAVAGKNKLRPIVCTTWYHLYNINLDDLSIDVPRENIAVYFGDITIYLNNANRDYNIAIHGKDTAALYSGKFPVVKGSLEIGQNKKYWSRNAIDGKTNIMLPGWPNYKNTAHP